MSPSLIALAGPIRGAIVELSKSALTIGRDTSNDLHPADLSLSRHHCSFTIEQEQVTIADLESMNGTLVNGVPVRSRVLEHGDQLKIGESVFLFLHKDAPPAAQSAVELDEAVGQPTLQFSKDDVVRLQSGEAADAFSATARRVRNLESLLRVSRALSSAGSANEIYQALFEVLFEVVPADCAAILWAGNGLADFSSVQTRSRGSDAPVLISRTIVRRVLDEGVAILSNDTSGDEGLREARSVVASRTRSVLCVPMMRSRRPEGVLYAASRDQSGEFDSDHLHLLTAAAGVAALAFRNVRQIERLERDTIALRAEISSQHSLIGESASMRQARDVMAKAARSDTTVLILGESGTGKELAAREIHQTSSRAQRPFVAINAAELAETLLESELFGHEKGAFTGAIAQKKGKLELAAGGTIFLDEIGDLAVGVQVKLLRVLQEREFTRVGGVRPIKIDVRFIAATNTDLDAAIKAGTFRQDLFYRLNVIALRMPPLRERPDDIPLLATFFVNRHARNCKRHIVGMTPEARGCLTRYGWPGNVRELENAIERAVVLGSTERLVPEDLPETVLESAAVGQAPTNYHAALQAAKQRIVLEAIERAAGQHADAARALGLHPNNLHRLIRHLGLRATRKA
jgi:two-component system, NtrC family, response regulator HydG